MSFFCSIFARNFEDKRKKIDMNKRILVLLFGVLMCRSGLQAERVMVIADPHVIPSALLQPGTAAQEMLDAGRKMLDLSESAFLALLDTAATHRPDLLLIPGDLTKDGEQMSHTWMRDQLATLESETGIKTLVIPGNHDINNPNAYSYNGDQKTSVASISDADFDLYYSAQMGAVRDPESHSYVAEPFPGVTILAIDGTHADAGTGWLSDNTLSWLLAQADGAVAKGHLVIAMCHWQLIDHVDQMSEFMAATQLKDAATIAEALAQHHVHLVLTGHFHVNGASTKYFGNDSIVEVTTGSPVAYPCPYRWLEISEDRSTVTVATEDIRSLDTITDLHAYSRAWQEAHTWTMIPQMARKAWGKVDSYVAQLKNSSSLTYKTMAMMIEAVLPQTDSARVKIFERNLGQAVVNMYMLHSDANEPEHPEKDSVKNAVYYGVANMIWEVMGSLPETILDPMVELAIDMMAVPVESMCEDLTATDDEDNPNRTDDLSPVLELNTPWKHQAVEQVSAEALHEQAYDLLGRPVNAPTKGQIIIRGKQKSVIK